MRSIPKPRDAMPAWTSSFGYMYISHYVFETLIYFNFRAIDTKCDLVISQQEIEKAHQSTLDELEDYKVRYKSEEQRISHDSSALLTYCIILTHQFPSLIIKAGMCSTGRRQDLVRG